MPSSFPPPNVERAHAQRRSGNYDDVDTERGYSNQQGSNYQQPNSNYQQQDSNYQQPNSNYQQPNSNYQQQSPNHQQPNSNYDQPVNYQSNVGNPLGIMEGNINHGPHSGQNIPPTGSAPPSRARSSRGKTFGSLLPSHRSRPGTNPTSPRPSPLLPQQQGGTLEVLRGHLVATSAEFFGTISFLWFALSGTQVAIMTNRNPLPSGDAEGSVAPLDPSVILYIALAFGFSLAVNAWVFYRVSGGLFNPAVVLGLCLSKALPWARGLALVPAQIAGGIVAAALVQAMFPGDVGVTVTRLSPDTSVVRGLFIEGMCTSLLVFTILMLAAEKHQATFMAPIGIGLSLFVAHLSGKCLP